MEFLKFSLSGFDDFLVYFGLSIGFVLPLASAVVHSVNPWDMALWAAIALAVQIVVYLVVRLLLPDVVARHIPEGKVSAGVLLGAVSLAAGILNAACMTPPA